MDEIGTSRKTNTDKQLNTVQKIFASSFCKQQHVGFAAQVLPTVNNRFSEIHENGSLCLCICGRGRRNENAENIANTSKNWYYKIHQDTSKYIKILQTAAGTKTQTFILMDKLTSRLHAMQNKRTLLHPPIPSPPTHSTSGRNLRIVARVGQTPTVDPTCCCAAHEDCKHLCKTGKSGQLWAVEMPFTSFHPHRDDFDVQSDDSMMQSLNQYTGCTTKAAKDLARLQTSVVARGLVLCSVNEQTKVTVEQALSNRNVSVDMTLPSAVNYLLKYQEVLYGHTR